MAAHTGRWIDRLPANTPRQGPQMEGLCLAPSRTATLSMYMALTKLGYKTYHFKEVGEKQNVRDHHIPCWKEAFDAKLYGRGQPYGREEFDKLLSRYSAVTDAPCACFAEALIAAYPNAKVILSTRDVERWMASMETAYYKILGWRSWQLLTILDPPIRVYTDVLYMPLKVWSGLGSRNDGGPGDWEDRDALRRGFFKHYENIRAVVPKEKLLEWKPTDGWEPLCKHLGKPIPGEPFPHINKGDSAAQMHERLWYIRMGRVMARWAKWPVLVVVGILLGRGLVGFWKGQGRVEHVWRGGTGLRGDGSREDD